MWRLVAFIFICALFLVFVVLNLGHTSDVSVGFRTFNEIPVFLTSFASFVFGMLFAIPFVLSFGKKHKKPPQTHGYDSPHIGEEKQSAGRKKTSGKGTKKKEPPDAGKIEKEQVSPPDATIDAVKKENSPYGID